MRLYCCRVVVHTIQNTYVFAHAQKPLYIERIATCKVNGVGVEREQNKIRYNTNRVQRAPHREKERNREGQKNEKGRMQ